MNDSAGDLMGDAALGDVESELGTGPVPPNASNDRAQEIARALMLEHKTIDQLSMKMLFEHAAAPIIRRASVI